jgi:hypothetical protein
MPRRPVPTDETKEQKFLRLASYRTNVILDGLRKLGSREHLRIPARHLVANSRKRVATSGSLITHTVSETVPPEQFKPPDGDGGPPQPSLRAV